MQIQVYGDNHIKSDTELTSLVEAEVNHALGRFSNHLTRIEVHISDENGAKGGIDKRCLIEARPAGHQPVTTSSEASEIEQAVKHASEKMKKALDSLFGKLDESRSSIPAGQ